MVTSEQGKNMGKRLSDKGLISKVYEKWIKLISRKRNSRGQPIVQQLSTVHREADPIWSSQFKSWPQQQLEKYA